MQINPFPPTNFERFERITTSLGKRPKEIYFERIEFNSLQEQLAFVEENLDCISWSMNID